MAGETKEIPAPAETPPPSSEKLGDTGRSSMQGELDAARAEQAQLDAEAKADAAALDTKFAPASADHQQAVRPVNETDLAQEERAAETLRGIDDLQPAQWEGLDESGRLKALQDAENALARAQDREAYEVIPEDMEPKRAGYFDDSAIYVNRHDLSNGDVEESVRTIVHEGRHAFQKHAVENPGVHPNAAEVEAWHINRLPGHYIRPENDLEGYRNQPIEADAFQFEDEVMRRLNGNSIAGDR